MTAGLAGQVGYIAFSCYYVYLLQEVCHMFSTLTKDGDAAVLREFQSPCHARVPSARAQPLSPRSLPSACQDGQYPFWLCSLFDRKLMLSLTCLDLANVGRVAARAHLVRVLGRALPRVRQGAEGHL